MGQPILASSRSTLQVRHQQLGEYGPAVEPDQDDAERSHGHERVRQSGRVTRPDESERLEAELAVDEDVVAEHVKGDRAECDQRDGSRDRVSFDERPERGEQQPER